MRKLFCVFILVGLSFLLFTSCKKSSSLPQIVTPDTYADTISRESNAFLESNSVDNPPLKSLLSYDNKPLGRLSGNHKNVRIEGKLIDALLIDAQALSDSKILVLASEGTNKPAQY